MCIVHIYIYMLIYANIFIYNAYKCKSIYVQRTHLHGRYQGIHYNFFIVVNLLLYLIYKLNFIMDMHYRENTVRLVLVRALYSVAFWGLR